MKQIELPDFEDMFKLAEEIGELTRMKLQLEHIIELTEAEVVKTVMKNPEYFVNSKPPSMEYVKTTYLRTGFDDNFMKTKTKLNITISKLETDKLKFQVYRDMIDVWRTVSANQRASVA